MMRLKIISMLTSLCWKIEDALNEEKSKRRKSKRQKNFLNPKGMCLKEVGSISNTKENCIIQRWLKSLNISTETQS